MWLSACSELAVAALSVQWSAGQGSGASFVELVALLHGSKDLVRFVVDSSMLDVVGRLATSLGLDMAVSEQVLSDVSVNLNGDRFQEWCKSRAIGQRAIYLSRSLDLAQSASRLDQAGDDTQLALLLGYPLCCVEAYSKCDYHSWWYDISCSTTERFSLCSSMNRLASLYSNASFLYDYFPCSFDCISSRKIATANRALLLDHGCSKLVANWDVLQQGEFIINPSGVQRMRSDGWHQCFGHAVDANPLSVRLKFNQA